MNSNINTNKNMRKIQQLIIYLIFLSSEFNDTSFSGFIILSHVITESRGFVDIAFDTFLFSSCTYIESSKIFFK